MTAVLVLAAMTACCVRAGVALAAARWPRRSPAAAIVLWQALGLGWGLAAVGTLLALGTAPQRSGVVRSAVGKLIGVAEHRGLPGTGFLADVQLACVIAGLLLLSLLVWVLLAA